MKLFRLSLFILGLFTFPSLVFAIIAADPNVFTDVQNANEAYTEIAWLKNEGIISGYPDGSFKPNDTINRAEFSKIVSIAAWDQDPATDLVNGDLPFTDLDPSAWYQPYIKKLYAKQVISGYPDGTFKPENSINFAEASKILSNAYSCSVVTQNSSSWWEPYTNKLFELYVVPYSIKNYEPWYAKSITRGEMAILIYNMEYSMDESGACPE